MQDALTIRNDNIGNLDTSASNQQYFTFILNDQEYGVDILRVQEIRGWTGVRKMPNLPDYIKGVIDLRGTVVPIIDLGERFGMESKEYTGLTVVVILKIITENKEKIMGLVVDSVSDVYDIPPAELKPAPDLGSQIDTTYIKNLATVGDKMVLLMDIDELLGDDMPRSVEKRQANSVKKEEASKKTGLNIKLLEDSFKALAPKGEELVRRFYQELFKRYPEVESMFAHTTLEEQEKKLLGALQLVIDNLGEPEKLSAVLKDLGAQHQRYGAVAEHYDAVASVLLFVMRELAGDLWTPEISGAWMTALTDIKDVMLSGYD